MTSVCLRMNLFGLNSLEFASIFEFLCVYIFTKFEKFQPQFLQTFFFPQHILFLSFCDSDFCMWDLWIWSHRFQQLSSLIFPLLLTLGTFCLPLSCSTVPSLSHLHPAIGLVAMPLLGSLPRPPHLPVLSLPVLPSISRGFDLTCWGIFMTASSKASFGSWHLCQGGWLPFTVP